MNSRHLNHTDEVIDTTDARQANSKKTNFRVLTVSLMLAIIVGTLLIGAFWYATPPGMDGTTDQPAVTAPASPPAAQPETPTPAPAPTTTP